MHNALFGTVIQADPDDGTVVIDPDGDHGLRLLPRDYVRPHLDHAYATTIHKAQGATYDRDGAKRMAADERDARTNPGNRDWCPPSDTAPGIRPRDRCFKRVWRYDSTTMGRTMP
ncbi:MAG TPA: hypothetical protein VFI47_07975, partial [Acidimicrobiales bacterium]|nr:hypothetical protein [Acidimicrobiales bacterium]